MRAEELSKGEKEVRENTVLAGKRKSVNGEEEREEVREARRKPGECQGQHFQKETVNSGCYGLRKCK